MSTRGYAIRADSLSKRYRVIRSAQRSTLRDALQDALTPNWDSRWVPGRKQGGSSGQSSDASFWALHDVSFEITPGETVGIIGNNGAGKTTLLKILSQITAPTSGKARLRGRVGSLLEVGTGFHTELTGRENVYLNGAVLGMRKLEIDRKFDEIVSFAGVEDFLDTPVKFYSDGMRTRLAFAVAAHLEPEILLVDEVLAVGDAAFQRKSIKRMEQVSHDGRTVLFVSHNLAAVKALCAKSMILDHGALTFLGETGEAVRSYLETNTAASSDVSEQMAQPSTGTEILSIRTQRADGSPAQMTPHDEALFVHIRARLSPRVIRTRGAHLELQVHNEALETILTSSDFEPDGISLMPSTPGLYEYRVRIPANFLSPGRYFLSAEVAAPGSRKQWHFHRLGYAGKFEIYDNGSILAQHNVPWQGFIHTPLKWIRMGEAAQPPVRNGRAGKSARRRNSGRAG